MTYLIAADGGHGGTDPGCVGNGLKEKDIVLKMVKIFKTYLEKNYIGAVVKLTRSSDKFIELSDRAALANKWGADLFISFHCNGGGGTGFETYRMKGVEGATKEFQSVVHKEVYKTIKAYGQISDRGMKSANYAVLRETKMKAILTETLFVDRKEDAERLKNDAFLKNVAEAHARGVAKYLGLKKKAAPSNTKTYTVKKGDTLYQIAKENHVTAKEIAALNSNIKDINKIYAGVKIKIPMK